MPRQRRRRRHRSTAARQRTADPTTDPREEQAARPTAGGRRRAWWLPTVGVFTAFFAGLWLGGTLSLTETVSAGALIAGAVGTGVGLARLVRQDLIRRRQRQAALDRQRAQEERDRLMRERVR